MRNLREIARRRLCLVFDSVGTNISYHGIQPLLLQSNKFQYYTLYIFALQTALKTQGLIVHLVCTNDSVIPWDYVCRTLLWYQRGNDSKNQVANWLLMLQNNTNQHKQQKINEHSKKNHDAECPVDFAGAKHERCLNVAPGALTGPP